MLSKIFRKKVLPLEALPAHDTITFSIPDETVDAYLNEADSAVRMKIVATALESFRQNPALTLPYRAGKKSYGYSFTVTINKL